MGHMHEHPELPLNHIYEAMAGLPIELRAIRLADVAESGVSDDIDVLINAGAAGDAWSGGDIWKKGELKAALNRFVAGGGALIGIGEPSAVNHGMRYFQMADVLGVDREIGQTICCGKYKYSKCQGHFITEGTPDIPPFHNAVNGVYALDGHTQVLLEEDGNVKLAVREFGAGRSVYMSGFTYSAQNTRLLYRAILWAVRREEQMQHWMPDQAECECGYYPKSRKLVVINNGAHQVQTTMRGENRVFCLTLEPLDTVIVDV